MEMEKEKRGQDWVCKWESTVKSRGRGVTQLCCVGRCRERNQGVRNARAGLDCSAGGYSESSV